MALLMDTIINETKDLYKFKVIAGSNGLFRSPQWIYFAEDASNANYLNGGELIIITGHSCDSSHWLYDFVVEICKADVSGLIINVGKYITEDAIGQDVIDFCNNNALPLITMPWEIHLADVTKDFSRRIFEYNQKYVDISYLFMSLIDGEHVSSKEERRLLEAGYPSNGSYTVAAFSTKKDASLKPNISLLFTEYFAKNNISISVFNYQDYIIMLFNGVPLDSLHIMLNCFFEQLSFQWDTAFSTMGIGCQVHMLSQLSKSFQTALEAIRLGRQHNQTLSFFDDFGLFKLFYSVRDRELLRSYCQCIKPVLDYDSLNDGDFCDTLYLYILHQKSIIKVSESMFCHRNTINYRIGKIKEMLALNLDDANDIFQIQMAFNILMYLGQWEPSSCFK